MIVKIPAGVSFLLIGSGLYWLLSSQLISSFTVLLPGLFDSSPFAANLIIVFGIISIVAGVWTVRIDFERMRALANEKAGFVYVLPILFAAVDLCSTLVSLSLVAQSVELNPFVASAIQFGSLTLLSFFISYLFLSQGFGLLMISLGTSLRRESPARFFPYAMICGVSSFGPVSNLLGLGVGYASSIVYVFGLIGSIVLATAVYEMLNRLC